MKNNFLTSHSFSKNKYLLLGHLTFFTLFVFSFLFAFERVLYIDSVAQVFEFIRDEGFEIYVQRYSMYLFQSLTVLVIKLHLPLSVVVYTYSLSVPIIGYLLWLITVYVLKNQKIGLLMLFIMLGIRQTFYHSISETFQLMFFASFLYAWLFQMQHFQKTIFSKILYYLIASIFIALCVFIHPVAAFFVLFILGMYLLNTNMSVFQKISIAILTIGMVCLKLLNTRQGGHDMTFLVSGQEIFDRISKLFILNSSRWYFEKIIDFYWMPLFMFVASLRFYWKTKRYWYFAFLSGFVSLFWVVTVVVYAGGGRGLDMERSFLPLFFFCGIPFVTEIFPNLSLKKNKVFFIGLSVLLIAGFTKIAVASIPYTKRLKKIEQIGVMANQQGKHKLLMTKETANTIFPIDSWGLGFESMIYSAVKNIDSTVNMYVVNDSTEFYNEKYKNINFYFAVPWWTFWEIDALNPHYFRLPKQLPSILTLEDEKLVIKDWE